MRTRATRLLLLPGLLVLGSLSISPRHAAAAADAAAADRAYPIHIHTRSIVGFRARNQTSVAVLDTSSDSWDGGDPTEREKSAGLRAVLDEEFLKIDADGDVIATNATVLTANRTAPDGTTEQEVLPAGAKITARVGDDGPVYTVDGRAPTEDERMILSAACYIPSPKEQKPNVEAVFGSRTPRKVGESWPVDAGEAVKLCKRYHHIDVTAADISGTVKLVAIETVNDIPCLRIEAQLTVDHYRPPMPDKPPVGVKVHDGTIVEKSTWLVPLDGNGEKQRASFSSDIHYSVSGTDGNRHYVSDIHERAAQEVRLKQLGASPAAASAPSTGPSSD